MSPPEITTLERKHVGFYVPSYKVTVGGSDLLRQEKLEISQVQVDNTLESSDQFSFTVNSSFDFANREFSHLENLFKLGAKVEISMGYPDVRRSTSMLKGVLTSVRSSFPSSGLPQLTVSGYDMSYCMGRGKKSKPWDDRKDSQVATEIAGDYDLKPVVEDSKVVHSRVEQSQESDWAFLQRLAQRNKFEVYVFGDELFFRPPGYQRSAVIALEWGKGLVSFSPEVNLAEQVSKIEVRGWNPQAKKEFVGKAGPGDEPGRDSGRRSGGEYLKAVCKNEEDRTLRVRRPFLSQQEADQRAQAMLKKRSESFVKGSGESIGLPEIRPDVSIELLGLGRFFSRTYYVEQSTHTIGSSGYKTTFKVKESTA